LNLFAKLLLDLKLPQTDPIMSGNTALSYTKKVVGVIANGLLRSNDGRDIDPGETPQWVNDLNNFSGEISIGAVDETVSVRVDRLIDQTDEVVNRVKAKINTAWNAIDKPMKTALEKACDDFFSSTGPVRTKNSGEARETLKRRWAVAIAATLLLGQQGEAAIRARDIAPAYLMLTMASIGKSVSQYIGIVKDHAFSLFQVGILMYQRNIATLATSLALENTIATEGKPPKGQAPIVIVLQSVSILGYIGWQERVGTSISRAVTQSAAFFLTPPSAVSEEEARFIHDDMAEEALVIGEKLQLWRAIRPLNDPDDPNKPGKGLSFGASLQAGDIDISLTKLEAILRLMLVESKRTTEKSAITIFGVVFAVAACLTSLDDATTLSALIAFTLFYAWRLDDQAKKPQRTIADAIGMLTQAGILILFALPWLTSAAIAQHFYGTKLWDNKIFALSGQISLPALNIAVGQLPGQKIVKFITKHKGRGEAINNSLNVMLQPLVNFIDKAFGPKQRAIAASLQKVLRACGYKPSENGRMLLARLREKYDEADTRSSAFLTSIDPTLFGEVVITALAEAASEDNDRIVDLADVGAAWRKMIRAMSKTTFETEDENEEDLTERDVSDTEQSNDILNIPSFDPYDFGSFLEALEHNRTSAPQDASAGSVDNILEKFTKYDAVNMGKGFDQVVIYGGGNAGMAMAAQSKFEYDPTINVLMCTPEDHPGKTKQLHSAPGSNLTSQWPNGFLKQSPVQVSHLVAALHNKRSIICVATLVDVHEAVAKDLARCNLAGSIVIGQPGLVLGKFIHESMEPTCRPDAVFHTDLTLHASRVTGYEPSTQQFGVTISGIKKQLHIAKYGSAMGPMERRLIASFFGLSLDGVKAVTPLQMLLQTLNPIVHPSLQLDHTKAILRGEKRKFYSGASSEAFQRVEGIHEEFRVLARAWGVNLAPLIDRVNAPYGYSYNSFEQLARNSPAHVNIDAKADLDARTLWEDQRLVGLFCEMADLVRVRVPKLQAVNKQALALIKEHCPHRLSNVMTFGKFGWTGLTREEVMINMNGYADE
jgi:NAD/NADP octopine/nopaline dehydrogenase, alpha-helical domain